MTPEECVRISSWYGYVISFHYRPDGDVETLSGYQSADSIAHVYHNGEEDAIRHTMHMVAIRAMLIICDIEHEKAGM
jgi:hypothetical protein